MCGHGGPNELLKELLTDLVPSFYADFGPLNLAMLYRYCCKLNKKLKVSGAAGAGPFSNTARQGEPGVRLGPLQRKAMLVGV